MKNELEDTYKVNLYFESKDELSPNIFVYPNSGIIKRDRDTHFEAFREYIRDDKLYVVIDGVMYNKAKLIYDSVNKDNLPLKRYKVTVTNGDISNPTINNIALADMNQITKHNIDYSESITVLFNNTTAEIPIRVLVERLGTQQYRITDEHGE